MLKIIQKNINELEKYTFPTSFFLQEPTHIIDQNKENLGECIYFIWINDKKIEYYLGGIIVNQVFLSPFRATFGGFCFEMENINTNNFLLFIQEIKIFLKQKNVKSMVIKNFPLCYAPEKNALIENILFQNKFQLKNSELNLHLKLNKNIVENFHTSEKRRFQKCVKNNFTFHTENQDIDLVFVHQFIKKSRERKNYPMTLDEQNFIHLIHTFPEKFRLFTVKKDEKIAALCVTIIMNDSILYSFYPADNVDFLVFSPLVFLFACLSSYALEHHFKILDLGIATDKGVINAGLLTFKQRLGAEISQKNEWFCDL